MSTTPSTRSDLRHTDPQRFLVIAVVAFAAIAPAVLMAAPAIAEQLISQLGLMPSQVGNLFAAELGAMSLATLPAYWWLSRFSWRRVALIAGVVFITGNVASSLTQEYGILMGLRMLSAFAGGSLMVLCISSAALTTNKDRVYGFWVMGQLVVGAVGLAVLPALFERFGLAIVYWLLAGLMAACLPLTRAFPELEDQRTFTTSTSSLPRVKAALGTLAVLTFYIGLSGVWTFIGSIASGSGLSAKTSGDILALATVMGILGAATATSIGARGARRLWLMLGYALMIVAVALLLKTPTLLRFALAALIFKFTWTFVLPFIMTTLAELDTSGQLMNTTNLVIGGGLAIGPALAGRALESSGGFEWLLVGAMGIVALSMMLVLTAQRPSARATSGSLSTFGEAS
ncbi:MFS transporter [Halomonas dongshanensis]|uniref:MFS transporter n=1 Tax=Halomonas dongshanensis TaxID=2890835 RepID=A0ABT2EBJ4_9GAMM|nr:MFS transporter [Halomonas dongshanensis]MCS2608029.1 MFS transporter [Halomonas dongshanensis]